MAMPPQFQPPAAGYGAAALAVGSHGPPPEKIEVMRAVKFVLSDQQNWKAHVLYAALLQFIVPIVGPITLLGWQAEISQRLVRNHPRPIPKFDFGDFMHYLQRGLTPFLVQLVVMLPMVMLWYGCFVAGMFASGLLAAAVGIPELFPVFFGLVAILAYFFLILFMVVFVGAFLLRAELTEDFSKSLSFGAVWRYCGATWKRSLGYGVLLAMLTFGMALLGIVACFIGLYFVVAFMSFAGMHLRYQIYAHYLAEGGEPIELKPVQVLPSEMTAQYQTPSGGAGGGYGGPPQGGGYGGPPQGGGYGGGPAGY